MSKIHIAFENLMHPFSTRFLTMHLSRWESASFEFNPIPLVLLVLPSSPEKVRLATIGVKPADLGQGVPNLRMRIEGNGRQRGHDVYPGSGPLNGGNTLLPA